ncbi:NAD(P)/FAD-dependent oxidoreductase [Mycolicibacterium sp. 018/SC-01/001]|uniref:NAD(P)/FAD-dependent oxidoreductase n=1 Tax=Mycolicibacterium sp. 018/SC-01/001 TaxID=2592069 RepID=UPI00117DCC96|nr:FAD/NAD(P)-binding oxidoreductase [Mycolicibacterium sp. 018/SC-01/001]TRW86150.1 NAD(P)/FAD-dependent oxidoreductase [Mycolicibacterium sp. 018/SC-01/001]
MTDSGLIVIGSGPAGLSAAEAYRSERSDGAIRIISADGSHPYDRPPLSKDFLRGESDDVELHPAEWFTERDIDLTLGTTVEQIDTAARTVTVDGTPYGYSALVLATGANPVPLSVPGGEHVLQLRSLDDGKRLRDAAGSARSAVVIGAGFIGCEAAASLAARGLSVTLAAPDEVPQQKRLGDEAGRRLKALVEATGVTYLGGVKVTAVEDGKVRLDNGTTLEADLVLAATGVTPNSSLAENLGISLENSRIPVQANMSAGVDGVYAAGDVAFAVNTAAGRALAVEHWFDAESQGKVAGTSAAGGDASWGDVPGFWTTIGDADVKYAAWGDGYDRSKFVDHGDGFTVWYTKGDATVGVLTYQADEDYENGEKLVAAGDPPPVDMG